MGQHNDAVFKDLLGYDDDKIAALKREGVI